MSDEQLDTIIDLLGEIKQVIELGGVKSTGGTSDPPQPDYGNKCVFHGAFGPCVCPSHDRNRVYLCHQCGGVHWYELTPLGAARICKEKAGAT